jgi:restriction endonuclease Mrr
VRGASASGYALERKVKRTDVQRFAGAMNKVKKGVFITIAKFAGNPRAFALGHEKTISGGRSAGGVLTGP